MLSEEVLECQATGGYRSSVEDDAKWQLAFAVHDLVRAEKKSVLAY